MWDEGYITVPQKSGEDVRIDYWVKHYEEPSEWGIEGGRISKLCLKVGAKDICSYDRGWDIKPESEEARFAFEILMHEYN